MSDEDGIERDFEINTETVEPRGVLVGVRDSGPGLSEETLPRLFEPFYTTKPGMGMGLSICRSIVEATAGAYAPAPTSPRGRTFSSPFPASERPLTGRERRWARLRGIRAETLAT